jgi:hypothetical protein
MNWWMVAAGAMALVCAAGHAVAGRGMFYRPIKADLRSELHAAVFTGMWHIITIHFTLSAIALIAVSIGWFELLRFAGSCCRRHSRLCLVK